MHIQEKQMADLTTVTQTFNAAKDSAAAYTEGVSALPGGLSAMANVVDNAKGALNAIPGIGAVTGAIGALGGAAGALNAIPGVGAVTGAIGALGGAAALASKGLDALKSGGAALSSLSGLGLSAKDSAALNSAMAGLTSGGSVPMKLPAVATGTFDRGEMMTMAASLLGSSKIPAFAAAGNPATFGTSMSAESIKKFDENKAAIAKAQDDYWAQQDVQTLAWTAWDNAKNNLPQGDPQIETLKTAWLAEGAKKEAIQKKIDDLRRA